MSNVFPIPRPPVPPAWCGHPGHPDWCDCGCGPPGCPPSTVDAWREMARFKEMLRSIIDEMGITAKPIPGVIDGSDAKPGFVGEFVTASHAMPFGASPANTQTTVSLIVMAPGDWDMWAALNTGVYDVGNAGFVLSPVPTGVSNNMNGWAGIAGTGTEFGSFTAVGKMARGSFSVPTLLPFFMEVDNTMAAAGVIPAGTVTLEFSARRVR